MSNTSFTLLDKVLWTAGYFFLILMSISVAYGIWDMIEDILEHRRRRQRIMRRFAEQDNWQHERKSRFEFGSSGRRGCELPDAAKHPSSDIETDERPMGVGP